MGPTNSMELYSTGPIRAMPAGVIVLRRPEAHNGLVVRNWSNDNKMPTVVARSWSAGDLHRGSQPSGLVRRSSGTPWTAGGAGGGGGRHQKHQKKKKKKKKKK